MKRIHLILSFVAMPVIANLCAISLCSFMALAQAQKTSDVAIVIQRQQVKFTATGEVAQMRFELYDQTGAVFFDSGPTAAAELNWSLNDNIGKTLASGLYAYKLTIKEHNAEAVRERRGHLILSRVQDKSGDRLYLTSADSASVGAEITLSESPAGTVADAQLSTSGKNTTNNTSTSATGRDNNAAGDDVNQKLVGAGTSNQLVRINDTRTTGGRRDDVQRGIEPRAVTSRTEAITSNRGATANAATIEAASRVREAVNGTGSANAAAKWTATTTIGDSIITDTGTNVGIGTTTPGSKLAVAGTIDTTTQYNIGGNRVLSNAGADNLFAGVGAGSANSTGNSNAFFGWQAGTNNTTGHNNAFFGIGAGQSNTTGTQNAFFGRYSGANNTTASLNAFFGASAGTENITGSNNAFFGGLAGMKNTTGSENSFFGYEAGNANTTGGLNAFFGSGAGYANTTGSANAFFGLNAGRSNTTAIDNAFFGAEAEMANTVGIDNSFLGRAAGRFNISGSENLFVGNYAGFFNTTSGKNAFVGYAAGYSNTTGRFNAFVGEFAGSSNTIGSYNTLIGSSTSNTTGDENTFSGYQAGASNKAGSRNTFSGVQSGNSNTIGNENSFNGYRAGYSNTEGYQNTFVGVQAGYLNATGYQNVFSGYQAGYSTISGHSNTFIGRQAGLNNLGDRNTAIGAGANILGGVHTRATALGSGAVANCNDCLILGGESDRVGIGTVSPTERLHVVGNLRVAGNIFATGTITPSDQRYKQNILSLRGSLEKIRRLRGVSYDWKYEAYPEMQFTTGTQLGFIAQEVETVLPEAVHKTASGMYAMNYVAIIPVLVEAIKQQQQIIEQQRCDAAAKDRQLEQLLQRMTVLERAVGKRRR